MPACLPQTIALIDVDHEFAKVLASSLREQGAEVDCFEDGNHLLAYTAPYRHDFYVVDLMLPGIHAIELIELLRRHTDAGVLVLSSRLAGDDFTNSIRAGADMVLAKPAPFEQVVLAISAVQPRVRSAKDTAPVWKLDRNCGELVAPDGARVGLSEADLAVLGCFVQANGEIVTRESLRQRLGRTDGQEADDGLNATIYRLRRRIERATPALVPLQSRSRVGYVFRAPLSEV